MDRILAELDKLHGVGFVKEHLTDLRTTLVVAEREGEDPAQ